MKKSEPLTKKFRNHKNFPPENEPTFFKASGEFRAPRKGEWYISGAIPEVYQAPNDLSTKFHIAIEVPAPPKTVVVDGFTYKLVMRC
jgi:protocatechuate 3,4-dioxygenase beta subunit